MHTESSPSGNSFNLPKSIVQLKQLASDSNSQCVTPTDVKVNLKGIATMMHYKMYNKNTYNNFVAVTDKHVTHWYYYSKDKAIHVLLYNYRSTLHSHTNTFIYKFIGEHCYNP